MMLQHFQQQTDWTAGRPAEHTLCVHEAMLLEVWHRPAETTTDLLEKDEERLLHDKVA